MNIVSSRPLHSQEPAILSRQFFHSPQPAGRKITAGFTYLQRISKAASIDVWFPDQLKTEINARLDAGETIASKQFPAQWAAVREFDLLQESGNHKIYDLDASQMKRCALDLSRSMRAGGYRVTVATIGTYQERSAGDELEILDTTLQHRIEQMIHMLYLDAESEEANARLNEKLSSSNWKFGDQLPHVGMVLGAHELYRRLPVEDKEEQASTKKKKTGKGGDAMSLSHRTHKSAQQFFDIIGLLPQTHIVHDTAIGLQLPELRGINQWNYIAAADETLAAFNLVLGNLFNNCVTHLRGYGDRLTSAHEGFYRNAAHSLGL